MTRLLGERVYTQSIATTALKAELFGELVPGIGVEKVISELDYSVRITGAAESSESWLAIGPKWPELALGEFTTRLNDQVHLETRNHKTFTLQR